MRAFLESVFDIAYLFLVIYAGVTMLRKGGSGLVKNFGVMALVLGIGDAFHLLPRMAALWASRASGDGFAAFAAPLGVGKLITSLTMTGFYLILYYVWRERYGIRKRQGLTAGMWGLAGLRALLCLLPQNRWLLPEPPISFGVLRNIPFLIMGVAIIYLFWEQSRVANDREFWHMPLAIGLSFALYIPVVLFSQRWPAVGMLMIPKTLAYVWIVYMGWRVYKRERMPKRNLK